MTRFIITVACLIAAPAISYSQDSWPTSGPYGPEQVEAVISDAIKNQLSIPVNADPPYWFSLATLGPAIPGTLEDGTLDNDAAVYANSLGNFIPPAETGKLVIDPNRRLDAWYKIVLNSIVFPKVNYSQEYEDATKQLFKLGEDGKPDLTLPKDRYERYLDAKDELLFLQDSIDSELMQGVPRSPEMNRDLRKAKRAMDCLGTAIEDPLEIFESAQFRRGTRQNQLRKRVLQKYQERSPEGAVETAAPLSMFFPSVKRWANNEGWRTVSFSSTDTNSFYRKEVRRLKARGGFRFGFIRFGGGGGRVKETEQKFNQVRSFKFKFSIKRVLIYRPWFDSALFESKKYTWRKLANSSEFPQITKAMKNGAPVDSLDKYDNDPIGVALMPVQLILAKGLSVEATTSKSDYDKIIATTNGGASGSLFGVFKLGGNGSSNVTQIRTSGQNVTFKVESSPGVTIIGAVSRVMPPTPDPVSRTEAPWGKDALLPQ
ncbi:MAG: hypothetical protein AAFX06_18510 [Planctomycetota bacterium]